MVWQHLLLVNRIHGWEPVLRTKLTDDVQITLTDGILIIKDIGRSWYISGFESDKECHVAKSVLEGKALEKKEKAIRIL